MSNINHFLVSFLASARFLGTTPEYGAIVLMVNDNWLAATINNNKINFSDFMNNGITATSNIIFFVQTKPLL